MRNKVYAILLAAGAGSRMGLQVTKQMIMLGNQTVLQRTLSAFDRCKRVDGIILVCRAEEVLAVKEQVSLYPCKVVDVISGGETRAMSARIGFNSVMDRCDFVAIHDVARCLIRPEEIDEVIGAAVANGAASATCPVFDTLKVVNPDSNVVSTLDRSTVRRAMTPQVFSCELYSRGLQACPSSKEITDDNMLMEAIGVCVKAVDISADNIKITTPDDLNYAEYVLSKRGELDV